MAVLKRNYGLRENHNYLLSSILLGSIVYKFMTAGNQNLSLKNIYFVAHFIARWTLSPVSAAQLSLLSYGPGVEPRWGSRPVIIVLVKAVVKS
jgi:hypothetical protein